MHKIEIFSQTISYKNLVILAFIGAELAGEQILPSPFPCGVHVILDPISGRGLMK